MRDRHDRGRRGPMSLPNPLTKTQLLRPETKIQVFTKSVNQAVGKILATAPEVLTGIDVGITEVPSVTMWHVGQVPLSSATAATKQDPARIVLYRRPLELRAGNQAELDDLVYHALAQQLAELTGIPLDEIAPDLED